MLQHVQRSRDLRVEDVFEDQETDGQGHLGRREVGGDDRRGRLAGGEQGSGAQAGEQRAGVHARIASRGRRRRYSMRRRT